jgi:Protein of unknown function (DUF3300)
MTSKREFTIMRSLVAFICSAVLLPGDTLAYMPARTQAPASSPQSQAAKIPSEQLDSLVAPIALYPDPLLAQTLAASTYPLELIQLEQWLEKNKSLKDKALADAVEKQPWDPSIQALAALPDVVKRLADDIQWTTDLGNAFLAQQTDVMEAVQRMRKKAQDKGNLQSTEQQKVETKVIEGSKVILIEQANPQVIYVPSYDPVYVYGPPLYPYPPIYYPPAGYYAAGMAISFGIGIAMGAFWGGGWGWGCGWGGNNVYINHNNNFNRNTNINGGNRNNIGGGNRNNIGGGDRNNIGNGNRNGIGGNRPSTLPSGGGGDRWQHNPQHRGGAPYRDRGTADRFGGTARGDSLANRQAGARQQLGRQGGNVSSGRGGGAGVSNRAGGGMSNRSGAGGGDRIGSRDVSRGGGGNRDAFGGGSRGSKGYNGSSARSGSSRGASSMGSRGGGSSRGGGGGRRR